MTSDAKRPCASLCGAFLLPHTFAKLTNIERRFAAFAKLGLRPPRFFVVLTAMLELIAAFGLITGLYPRLGAADRGDHPGRRGLGDRARSMA